MIISDDRLMKALQYLATTDEEAATLKADVERKEYQLKRSKALSFQLAQGTVADRNAFAEVQSEPSAEAWFKAIEDNEKVKAKRQTEALIVDVYRTLAANRRAGSL